MALFGTGVAAADDYAGQTYADASSAASDAGATLIVASRVGDKVAQDDCIVTSSQNAPFMPWATTASHVTDTVQFNLNCNGGYATANTPGRLAGQPGGPGSQGRRAAAAAEGSSRRSKR